MLEMQAPTIAAQSASIDAVRVGSASLRKEYRQTLKGIMRTASIVLSVYWLLIFVGTHLPKNALPNVSWSDKLYHFGAFAGLSFLLCWAIPSSRFSLRTILAAALVMAIGYAAVDEWTQQFVAGRTCDIYDFFADAFGAVLGVCSYCIARRLVSTNLRLRRILALP